MSNYRLPPIWPPIPTIRGNQAVKVALERACRARGAEIPFAVASLLKPVCLDDQPLAIDGRATAGHAQPGAALHQSGDNQPID